MLSHVIIERQLYREKDLDKWKVTRSIRYLARSLVAPVHKIEIDFFLPQQQTIKLRATKQEGRKILTTTTALRLTIAFQLQYC